MTFQAREHADALASPFQGLLLHATELTRQVLFGEHGRRDVGAGEEFWQFRPFENYLDPPQAIDWRRSAKGDDLFVRQYEHKVSQSLMVWVDPDARMQLGDTGLATKSYYGSVLALAASQLAAKSGEKIGLIGDEKRAVGGEIGVQNIHAGLEAQLGDLQAAQPTSKSMNLLISDVLGDMDAIENFVAKASDVGQSGVLLQLVDPVEVSFPFKGRVLFQGGGASEVHETHMAQDLRQAYLERFAQRRDALTVLAKRANWTYLFATTDRPYLNVMQNLHLSLSKRGQR